MGESVPQERQPGALTLSEDGRRVLAVWAACAERTLSLFERFTASAQKATLWWVTSAKRSETRARRIAELVRLAADNRTILQR
jgi:uncharacterized protein YdeI (YjbR/CyaY-like superfamily)